MSAPAGAAHDADIRTIREESTSAGLPFRVHPEWQATFPWLVQGITARSDGDAFDLSLFGDTPTALVQQRWLSLRRATGTGRAVHARQVHGGRVLVHHETTAPGVLILDDADGHATSTPGLLLTVSVADCVPVSLVDANRRVVALLHAGWRGVAAGILENGVATLREVFGCAPRTLRMHLGPAICGDCYEVGPEVHAALGVDRPAGRLPVDLRAILVMRARGLGLTPDNLTVSGHCTLHGGVFHSHRGGAPERQMAVLGVRDA